MLIFSGRISSEILLKAAKIGVGVILSKSAPTTLAITLANDLNITAIGFIRDGSFNIYSHPERSHRVVGIISSNYSVAYLINFFFNYVVNKTLIHITLFRVHIFCVFSIATSITGRSFAKLPMYACIVDPIPCL